MGPIIRRTYQGLPSSLLADIQALCSRKPLLAPVGVSAVPIEIDARKVSVKASHLARYRAVCGIPPASTLPPAYPHVLAMPLHMQVFTAASFPVKVLGLIHMHNVIRQWHPIPVNAPLHLFGGFNTVRETERGQEYDLLTRCEVDGAVMWEEVSTMLARGSGAGKRPRAPKAPKDGTAIRSMIGVAPNTGRRYAFVSGDFNPIHLAARTARIFRFDRAVAHGMWSMARCLGEAATTLPAAPLEIETQFQFPLFLPAQTTYQSWQAVDVLHITLSDERGLKPHLSIKVQSLAVHPTPQSSP